MREFTDFEKQIIHKMVSAKEIRELSLIKLIDENTDAISLEWNIIEPSFKIFYYPPHLSDDELFKLFNQVQDIIFLLKFLEDNGLIYLHKNEKFTENNWLFNPKKYKRDNDGRYYEMIPVMIDNATGYRIISGPYQINTDFGSYVRIYANALFYVSNALRELEKDNFKTPEQLRFEKQLNDADKKHKVAMEKAQAQVKYSRWAFYGSIAALIASSVFGLVQMCSETTLDKDQLNQIKHSIEQKTLPDVIKTEITNDTLTTRVVEKPQTRSKKQIK